ncbi:MAG TPA: ABC transporter substrate-binding protein [Candidatus Pullichristensenella stercorigallinarum]|uniref:ABC transporter substrate-binding protein n=1 Tax=Candidatus Pullichristensenella stercorigallinarum TaxID=2840909 RepID=A0A9D1CXY1_9FIRM|nr:ABC transporter substrate-binding protein [Candidatus Pullichristensenella stercorigallinarum]
MKKVLTLTLCLLLCLSFLSVGSAETVDTVKIGLIFPLSGSNADQGVFNVDAATLAMDDINAAGGIKSLGGAQIELVIYDNESDSDVSRTTAERLLAENPDVVAVHGASASAYVLPMLSVFERNQVPFLTAQTSESIVGQGYQYVFAFASLSPQFAQTQVDMLNWLNETYEGLNLTKVGIVYEDTEWGLTNSAAAREAIANAEGLELVYDQAYTPSASDLSSIVVGLMSAGVEVVFPTSYTQDARLLFNTMVSYDYSPLIVGGGGGMLYPAFGQNLGELVDGVLSVGSHNYDAATILNNEELADVGERFEERFGYFLPEQGVSAYNAVYIVAQALENCASTDPTDVMNAIRELTISTLTPGGELKFEENGWNSNSVAVMMQWQLDEDGEYRPHTVFPDSEATVEFQLTDLLRERLGE